MPSEVILPQLRKLTLGKLHDLKREWGVSMQAIIERAYSAKLLTAPQRTNLYKSMSARGWRTQEPLSDFLTPEHANLTRSIGDALTARGLSLDDIAELVGVASAEHPHPFRPSTIRLSVV
jgi:Zn-dependent peptidase ImmA (M78 family)